MVTEDQKRAYQRREQQEKAQQAALSKRKDACVKKDIGQLHELFHSGQHSHTDAEIAIWTTIKDDWLGGIRYLLKQGVNPNTNS